MVSQRSLLVVTSDPEGPVVRHRWRAFAPRLAEAGIQLVWGPWPKHRRVRRETLDRAGRVDGVVVSSRLLNRRDVRALRSRTPHLGFDFDDALPFRDSHRGATRSPTRRRRFRAILEAADRVTVGNSYLAQLAVEAGPGRGAPTILPTVVATPARPPNPEPADDLPVIGWIGSRATLPYLEARTMVLSALVAAGHSYRLRVIADKPPVLPPGIVVETVPWRLENWSEMLSETHFGLAPLPDDPWTRGKCGLRLLQTLSVGRPVVASAVGVQAEQVRHGETGYLADSRESFLDGIQNLMEDGARRREMGLAGFEDVRACWCVDAWADRVLAEVEALLAGDAA